MVSIRKLKLRGDSILASFGLIFKSCLQSGTFPLEGKKTNVVVVVKKGWQAIF